MRPYTTAMFTHFLITGTLQRVELSFLPFFPQKPVLNEEQTLLAAVIAGDQRAYLTLVTRFHKTVLSIIGNIIHNHEEAEEAVQDAFMRVHRYLPTFRGESSFKTWLSHIARTTALTKLRNKNRLTLSLDALESVAGHLPDKNDTSLQILLRSERADLLNQAMQRLSREDETALQLFYWHDQSLEEICATTGWTLSNTKSRVSRARKRLRKVLVEQFDWEDFN